MKNWLRWGKGKARILILQSSDFVLMTTAYALILQRIQVQTPGFANRDLLATVLSMIVCTSAFRLVFSVHRQVWRYASAGAYLRMVLADFFGGLAFLVVDMFALGHITPFAHAVAAIGTGLLLSLSSRFVYQVLRRHPEILSGVIKQPAASVNKSNVAIVGAGELGVLLARELLASRAARYYPYCFFDNDKRKIGTVIEGIPVYGPDAQMVRQIDSMPIQDIIIALPNMSAEAQRQVFETYKNTNCRVMIYDYPMSGQDGPGEKRTIREVSIEDLLFREMVSLDDGGITEMYRGKTLLVTGAGGSIGGELCRQLAKLKPGLLVLLDVYENGVYEIQQELIRRYGFQLTLETVIASICDKERMQYVFSTYKPDYVFHAAAHKHVPLMENNCIEAVRNNVYGTYNVVNAAEKAGVKRFVMISTDKAVNPTNVMGATKRMCEMIIQSRKESRTDFVAVRFGNVLGSNGSVVPLFKRQIAEGGPITITDKRIIRYFMAIPEAAQLVIRTGCRGEKGELYVLDMGKPVRIIDLAENLISLSGLIPYKDIDIKEIGLRPGEKLYEELLVDTGACQKTEDSRIFIEKESGYDREEVDAMLKSMSAQLDLDTSNESVKALMMRLVPTYMLPEQVNGGAEDSREFQDTGEHAYHRAGFASGSSA